MELSHGGNVFSKLQRFLGHLLCDPASFQPKAILRTELESGSYNPLRF